MIVALWMVSLASPVIRSGNSKDFRSGSARHAGRQVRRYRAALLSLAIVIPVGATLCFLVLALATPAPLNINIQSVQTNGQFRAIWKIKAVVVNSPGSGVTPHFATDASGYMTTFWNRVSGPRVLNAGQKGVYTLVAPNIGSMPGVTQPFFLQAVTATPQTISSSQLFTPESFECAISPSYVDRIVPLGRTVTLNVELRSPYGAPVHRQGVPVALGQVIYGQNTLIPGEAQINGRPPGESPVVGRTDSSGTVTFRIRDSYVQGGNPVYFQAYVTPTNGFPYGYSEIVSVQWSLGTDAHTSQ